MPYIKKKDREKFDKHLNKPTIPETSGELNYVLTRICHKYLENKVVNYENINSVIGVLECCKSELYRRIASVYEDEKIDENGDVIIKL